MSAIVTKLQNLNFHSQVEDVYEHLEKASSEREKKKRKVAYGRITSCALKTLRDVFRENGLQLDEQLVSSGFQGVNVSRKLVCAVLHPLWIQISVEMFREYCLMTANITDRAAYVKKEGSAEEAFLHGLVQGIRDWLAEREKITRVATRVCKGLTQPLESKINDIGNTRPTFAQCRQMFKSLAAEGESRDGESASSAKSPVISFAN